MTTAPEGWGDQMSDCEWDPMLGEPAKVGRGCPNKAALSVGAHGEWHLCRSCAALPRFKRYKVRKPLPGDPDAKRR